VRPREGAGMAVARRGESAPGLRAEQGGESAPGLLADQGGESAPGLCAEQGGESAPGVLAAQQNEPGEPAGAPDGEIRQEISVARTIRAQNLVSGRTPAEIAAIIHDQCGLSFGTTWIRAYRLAHGIALADVVAQVRARYVAEGRTQPRFSETLLSSYESAQKRPGPEYLHYLCAVYQADPKDLGYQGLCFCGNSHARRPSAAVTGSAGAAVTGSAGATAAGSASATAAGSASATAAGSAGATAAGSASDAVPFPADGRGAVAPGGPRRVAARRRPALRPVPEPRHGDGAVIIGLPPGVAAAAGSDPVGSAALVPPTVWGAGPDVGGDADDDLLRRALLPLIGGPGADAGTAVDGRFFGAVDRIRRRMDEALLGASVSATMLDQWEDITGGYGRQYGIAAPLRLLCDVLLDLGDVRRMCEERQPVEFAERLCRLAAKLAALSGMTMINIGDQRLARSFFRTARMAADETADRHLRGWVTVRESLVPLYYGDPGEAALLARSGGDLAGRHACVARVLALVLESRALARLAAAGRGSVRETLGQVRATFEQASLALDGLPEELRSGTAFGYTERQLLFDQGDALVTLGDHQGAEDAFEQSLQMFSRAEILDRSLIMLGLARCRLEAGEPEEALRLSRDTVFAPPHQHRSGLVVRTAQALGESVAAEYGDRPAFREYREALLTG
jgi:tetratricopeptide (TPR) repeat protein